MTSRERVLRAIEFKTPDRVPFFAATPPISDIFFMPVMPARDWQPDDAYYPDIHPQIYAVSNWRYKKHLPSDLHRTVGYERQDEFGCVWKTILVNNKGEVIDSPLKSWDDLETLKFPDPDAPGRFAAFEVYRRLLARRSFVLGALDAGIFERCHLLRGFDKLMMDFALEPDKIARLADRLIEEWYLPMIDNFARFGCNGVMMLDDWGTQNNLLISPKQWRAIYKPRYKRLFDAAHARGLKFFLHSCGHIRAILPDLIEIGLDVIQKDDICFMGLDEFASEFGGKICFMGPLDMQRVMPGASYELIEQSVKDILRALATHGGGVIGSYYFQPEASGATWKQMFAMQAAYLQYGRYPIKC